MCFTSGPTTDDERGPSLMQGLRAKLLQTSGRQRNKSKRLPSRRSSSYARVKRQAVAKVMALTAQDSQSKTVLISRQGSRAETNTLQITEAKTNSLSGGGRESNGYKSDSESKLLSVSRRGVQSERFVSDRQNGQKPDKTIFIRAVSMVNMNTKQMKLIFTGMGKEFRRVANTVGDKPSPTKKKNTEVRERQELLYGEVPKPYVRTPEEIKKAYGHSDDVRQAANITHAKLRERGEKLSAVQRRTAELESDAANFSSLAQELVRKMENRKWYEI